jgi:MOSC domain-containing protein YiiM
MTPDPVLVSISAGLPRTVEWRGQTIRTSIFKAPITGRVAIRGVNVAGDDQADKRVHGGADMAVYAYAAEDYDWWEARGVAHLGPGTFGENLTTRGIEVSRAFVGERWRVGSALLEVVSPRIPCYKLGMRMDDPMFVKRFADALLPGAYLRIIEEGEAAAGDPILLVERPQAEVTVADVARLRFKPGPGIAQLVTLDRLPDSWREWAAEALARA